jgi:hypothetical protein
MAVSNFDPSTAVAVDDAPTSAFDPSSAVPVEDTTPPETAGRIAGLTARAAIGGAAGLPNTILDLATPIKTAMGAAAPVAHAIRQKLGLDPADPTPQQQPAAPQGDQKPTLDDFVHPDKWPAAAKYFADKALGTPQPQTPGERLYSRAVESVPSAALVPEAPIMGALSNAAGGAASQTVAENGGGPLAQTLAGLAVGSAPGVGAYAASSLIKGATRGGAAGQAAMQSRLADAAANGMNLTAGQATGSHVLQRVEAASGKLWGGGPLSEAATTQTQNIGNHVENIVENLAQGGEVSPTAAGQAINAGGNATKATMRQAEKAAYDKVDTLVPPDAPVDVSGTLAKLDSLVTPTPGAANTTAALTPSKLTTLRDNLRADIEANGGSTQLPYSAATQLRTALGNSIDWGFSPADPVANAALKQVHGALKADIDAGASAISPEASQAVSDARSLYAANQARRDFLNSIIEKAGGPEAVYAAATNGTKQGATKIDGVMKALDPEQQNLVRATVIDRLGKAIPSQQNATGSAFDSGTFLTNWNKLDPAAKDALFGKSGNAGTLRAGLDSLAKTVATVRSSSLLKNPSGSGAAVGHGLGLASLLEGGGALLAGHPGHLAAAGGAVMANNILARALTNPRVVHWLATSTKLPAGALPNAVTQLAQLGRAKNDPEARDLAAYLQAQQQRQ